MRLTSIFYNKDDLGSSGLMCFEMSEPGFIWFLHFVTQRTRVAEVEVSGLHVVSDVALHGAGVLALQAAKALSRAKGQDLGHDHGLVQLHRAPLVSWW